MTVAPLNTPGEATLALSDLVRDHGADLPASIYAAVAGFMPSIVDRSVACAEALYAAAQQLAAGPARDAAATVAKQLADYVAANQWYDLGWIADRATPMSGACARILGLGSQPTADDPIPLAQYAAA